MISQDVKTRKIFINDLVGKDGSLAFYSINLSLLKVRDITLIFKVALLKDSYCYFMQRGILEFSQGNFLSADEEPVCF